MGLSGCLNRLLSCSTDGYDQVLVAGFDNEDGWPSGMVLVVWHMWLSEEICKVRFELLGYGLQWGTKVASVEDLVGMKDQIVCVTGFGLQYGEVELICMTEGLSFDSGHGFEGVTMVTNDNNKKNERREGLPDLQIPEPSVILLLLLSLVLPIGLSSSFQSLPLLIRALFLPIPFFLNFFLFLFSLKVHRLSPLLLYFLFFLESHGSLSPLLPFYFLSIFFFPFSFLDPFHSKKPKPRSILPLFNFYFYFLSFFLH
ncbi:hypothetical protein NE237_014544 [Protea cynaroides]|uniref:Uncharacterized protein n=1 Tax=Protea cynaroides TaxID=273540 RepID=A0A9Q0QQ80_9MAGN|nr:hypothetical protein NE237_014544 [Protea cynaroides]